MVHSSDANYFNFFKKSQGLQDIATRNTQEYTILSSVKFTHGTCFSRLRCFHRTEGRILSVILVQNLTNEGAKDLQQARF